VRVISPPISYTLAARPSLFRFPRLLIQYIHSCPLYLEAVSSIRNPRTRHAVVIGTHLTRLHEQSFTHSMVQDIILKADCHSACQKNILLSSWNPKVHYRFHTSPPLDPILSQPNPVRHLDPYLPNVHLNVILPPTPRYSQWSLAFGPPNQNPVNISPLPCMPYVPPTSSSLI
jgi:hypothetical protein